MSPGTSGCDLLGNKISADVINIRFLIQGDERARQAPLSMGLPRQESWSELPFPPPEDLPNSRINFPAAPALAARFFYH